MIISLLVLCVYAESFSHLFNIIRDRSVSLFNWRELVKFREGERAQAHAKRMIILNGLPHIFEQRFQSGSKSKKNGNALSLNLRVNSSSLCQQFIEFSEEVDRVSEALDRNKKPFSYVLQLFSFSWFGRHLDSRTIWLAAAEMRERISKDGRARVRDACVKYGLEGGLNAIRTIDLDVGPAYSPDLDKRPLEDRTTLEKAFLAQISQQTTFLNQASNFVRAIKGSPNFNLILHAVDCFRGVQDWETGLAQWSAEYELKDGTLEMGLAWEITSNIVSNWLGDRILGRQLPRDAFRALSSLLPRNIIPMLLLFLKQLQSRARTIHTGLPALIDTWQRGLLQSFTVDNLEPNSTEEQAKTLYGPMETMIVRMDVGETILISAANQPHTWLVELTKKEARVWSALIINSGLRIDEFHPREPGSRKYLPWAKFDNLSLDDLRACHFFRDGKEPSITPLYPSNRQKFVPPPVWPNLRHEYTYGQSSITCVSRSILLWLRITAMRALGPQEGLSVYRQVKVYLNLQFIQAMLQAATSPSFDTHPFEYEIVRRLKEGLNHSKNTPHHFNLATLLDNESPWNLCIKYNLAKARSLVAIFGADSPAGLFITNLLETSLRHIQAMPGMSTDLSQWAEQQYSNPDMTILGSAQENHPFAVFRYIYPSFQPPPKLLPYQPVIHRKQ